MATTATANVTSNETLSAHQVSTLQMLHGLFVSYETALRLGSMDGYREAHRIRQRLGEVGPVGVDLGLEDIPYYQQMVAQYRLLAGAHREALGLMQQQMGGDTALIVRGLGPFLPLDLDQGSPP